MKTIIPTKPTARSLVLALLFAGSQLTATFAQTTLTVDRNTRFQTIEGFGGFGPKKVWWDAPPYFDAEYLNQTVDNMGVSIFRTQIYWDGENTNDNNDPNVANPAGFDFGPNSDNGKQFPFIQALNAKGAKLIATVWTPPIWMKLYDDPSRRPNPLPTWCGGCQQVGGRTNPALYEEFAEYLVVYVRTLKQQTGVDLYGISIQNEPLFPNPFESNVVKPDEFAAMLKVVGARFKREGLTTKFFGPEHMGEYTWVPGNREYVQRTLGDATVKPYLDIFAVHAYTDGVAADYGSAQGWTDLYQNVTVTHGKPLWMTETSDEGKAGFDLGFDMAKSLYLALRFGHISGWVYWYMADVAIKDNQLTPLGYAFKNFYRYIRPGAVNVASTVGDADILPLAFVHPTDKTTTLILINNGSSSKSVTLNAGSGSPAQYTLYRTSATENTANVGTVTGTGTVQLPAKSITTLQGNDVGTTTVAVTGVAVSPGSASVAIGQTIQLTASVAPANATNKNVSWSSANTAVATVNTSGVVTAVAAGNAVITITTADGARTATSTITVPAAPPVTVAVTGVAVSPGSASVAVGQTIQLTATVAPTNATNKNVSWTSANTAVATVNASGVVAAVAAGNAVITVTTADGARTATSTIIVPTPVIPPAGTGRIIREFWNNVPGTSVSNIPLTQAASGTAVLTSLEGPTDVAENYGDRIRGYIIPTTTGAYTFYIAGDDNSELYLSTNSSPTGKTRIAQVSGWTGSREWTKDPAQKSAVINLIAGQKYYVEVLHKEGVGGDNVAVGWTGPGIAAITVIGGANIAPFETTTPPPVATGRIIRELWTGITGTSVSNIPLTQPVSITSVLTSLEGPTDSGDNYGDRIRGYIIPTTTGAYTFYVAGDDNSELYLSTNDSPAGKIRIAQVTGWSNPREWIREAGQKSAVINLVAGQKYYVEVLHKEGGGGDNVAVGWTGPGIAAITVIGGANIAPFETSTPPPVVTGRIIREFWSNIFGRTVSDIPLTQPVSSTSVLTSLEGPTDVDENYGDRIRGYIIPTTTGAYTFYVAGDDNVDLYLSTNNTVASKTRIAYVNDWTNSREWLKDPGQKSAAISLVAGQRYYVEILHKEGGGGDHVAVGWTGPGIAAITVIGGVNISPFETTGSARLFAESKVSAEMSIQVYPNPVSNELTISGLAAPSLVEIMGYDGRAIKRHNQVPNKGRISVSDLATGLYILRISNDIQGRTSHKIIKQ